MLDTFKKIAALLDARDRRKAVLLFAMMLAMSIWDAVGVASVMPFIAVVSAPDIVERNPHLHRLYSELGFTSVDSFLIFLGMGVFILVIGSLIFKALTDWATTRYVNMRSYSLSCRLLQTYLNRPYTYFLNNHTANLGKSVLSEVQHVVSGGLMPAMQLVSNLMVAVLLFGLVVIVEPATAIAALLVFGSSYITIYVFVRGRLKRIGSERMLANRDRFKAAQDALGGIKDVKVLGLEESCMRAFRKPALVYSRSLTTNQIIAAMPQYILQGLAFGGIIVILLALLSVRRGEISQVLPIMALYAFASLRLLPAVQQIYLAATKLRYSRPALEALHADLADGASAAGEPAESAANAVSPLRLQKQLRLERVSYCYPNAASPALRDITLSIDANTTVGLVGATGGGKTTAVDIILGLLEPQDGQILVDGIAVTPANVRSWQRNVGYVPQHIFLVDDSVSANIAFGVAKRHVDREAVERATRIAELHDFVTQQLPQGYDTAIGERGIRLSGGQRQRIGIARALYNDPSVLVFDEATSSLDNITERAVMEAVANIAHHKTVILIAHRLSTVQTCDKIFVLERGQINAAGTYTELLATSGNFRSLANV